MKIPQLTQSSPATPVEGSSSVSRGKADKASTAGEGGGVDTRESVKVNVSARARELADKPQVDEAKVARLREAIENGSFKVDAQKLASAIVEKA